MAFEEKKKKSDCADGREKDVAEQLCASAAASFLESRR